MTKEHYLILAGIIFLLVFAGIFVYANELANCVGAVCSVN